MAGIVLVIAAAEAILQPLRVIPWPLQGLLILLSVVLVLLIGGTFSAFVTVRVGPGWIATHRRQWRMIATSRLSSIDVSGPSPKWASVTLGDSSGNRLFLGMIAARDPAVRKELQSIARSAPALSKAVCVALDLHRAPSTASEEIGVWRVLKGRLPFLIGMLALIVGNLVRVTDSWSAFAAIIAVLVALYGALLWWITAKLRWTRR
jgi:hypothetical protein